MRVRPHLVRISSEFVSRLVDLWAYANSATMERFRPGKSTDNAFIESFNGSLRDECLNVYGFDELTDARLHLAIQKKAPDYNDAHLV